MRDMLFKKLPLYFLENENKWCRWQYFENRYDYKGAFECLTKVVKMIIDAQTLQSDN